MAERHEVHLQPYKVITIPNIGVVGVPEENFHTHEGLADWSNAIRQHRTAFRDSQGGTHSVPSIRLDDARKIDPDLEVLGGFNS